MCAAHGGFIPAGPAGQDETARTSNMTSSLISAETLSNASMVNAPLQSGAILRRPPCHSETRPGYPAVPDPSRLRRPCANRAKSCYAMPMNERVKKLSEEIRKLSPHETQADLTWTSCWC